MAKVGPTFYRMTKAALKDQVGRNIFTYVDDIIVARCDRTTSEMRDSSPQDRSGDS
jgi:hypothetical protein